MDKAQNYSKLNIGRKHENISGSDFRRSKSSFQLSCTKI